MILDCHKDLIKDSKRRLKSYSRMIKKATKAKPVKDGNHPMAKYRLATSWVARNLSYKSMDPKEGVYTLEQGFGDADQIAMVLVDTLRELGVEDAKIQQGMLRRSGMGHTIVRVGPLYLCPIYGVSKYPRDFQ